MRRKVKNALAQTLLSSSWTGGLQGGGQWVGKLPARWRELLLEWKGTQRVLIEAASILRSESFRQKTRSLDPVVVGQNALPWLRTRWSCSNILWLPGESLPRELQHYDSGKNPDAHTHTATRSQIQFALPHLAPNLSNLFARWPATLPKANELQTTPMVLVDNANQCDLIYPIFKPIDSSGKSAAYGVSSCLGHFVFLDFLNGRKALQGIELAKQMEIFADRIDHAQQQSATRELTYRDELTDLYNQRYLPVLLDQMISRSSSVGIPFSVLFVDVDRFKSVNDQNGHLVGSQILVEISQLLRSAIRRTDFAFRYGGDEYVIVLPGASAAGALRAAERIRAKTEGSVFTLSESVGRIKVTISIGVAAFPEHATSTRDILRIADEAMYASKRDSRNTVRLAS